MYNLLLTDVTTIEEGLEEVAEKANRLQEYLDTYLPSVLSFGIRLILTVVFFFVGVKVIKVIRKILSRSLERANADTGLIQFMDSLVKVILYFLLIMTLASSFGIDTTSVMALVGSAGLTIGLAFQGTLSNFAGGVLILLLKPFKVGDYIIDTGENLEGTVTEIQMFYTHLLTLDNREVVIPNGTLSDNSVVNVTARDKRRLDIDVGISYSADLRLAKEVCLRLLEEDESVLKDEEHIVVVSELSDSSVVLKLRFWVLPGDYWAAKWRITEDVKLTLDANGIEIPFNQLDVNLKRE